MANFIHDLKPGPEHVAHNNQEIDRIAAAARQERLFLQLEAGTYYFGRPLTIDASHGFALHGRGSALTEIAWQAPGPGQAMIRFSSTGNEIGSFDMRGIHVGIANTDQGRDGSIGVHLHRVLGATIADVSFFRFHEAVVLAGTATGFSLPGHAHQVHIRDCQRTWTNTHSIVTYFGTLHLTLENLFLQGVDRQRYVVHIRGGEEIRIFSTKVFGGSGILIDGGGNPPDPQRNNQRRLFLVRCSDLVIEEPGADLTDEFSNCAMHIEKVSTVYVESSWFGQSYGRKPAAVFVKECEEVFFGPNNRIHSATCALALQAVRDFAVFENSFSHMYTVHQKYKNEARGPVALQLDGVHDGLVHNNTFVNMDGPGSGPDNAAHPFKVFGYGSSWRIHFYENFWRKDGQNSWAWDRRYDRRGENPGLGDSSAQDLLGRWAGSVRDNRIET